MTKKEQRKLVARQPVSSRSFGLNSVVWRQFQEANFDLRKENAELHDANANLRVERDAADVLARRRDGRGAGTGRL